MPLNQVVPSENVMQSIKSNVIVREIPGAVAEIAGEGASSLFSAEFHRKTTVDTIISGRQVEEWIDKTLELKEHREALMEKMLQQPVYGQMIADVMYQGIVRYIYEDNLLTKKVPAISSVLKLGTKMVNKTVPNLESAVEDNVKAYISENISSLIKHSQTFLEDSLDAEQLKEVVLDIWSGIETKQLGELQDGIDNIDLSEFVVLGYEFWKTFRETDYFLACCQHIVDHIYEKYGDQPAAAILSDFGASPEIAYQQIEGYLPDTLASLKQVGFIEQLIRQRLEGFYLSGIPESVLTGKN
jgi:hypothetical protein